MDKKKTIRRNFQADMRLCRQHQVANAISLQETIKKQLYGELFAKGCHWCSKGKKIEDAPSELANNQAFIEGFNSRANRVKLINDTLYELGQLHYLNGDTGTDMDQKYRDNDYYIKGFEDAKNGVLSDSVRKKKPR